MNASLRIDSIPLCCADVTRNIRGLCAGDVNGTYLPGNGYKTAQPGLSLVHEGETPVAEEMVFPVRLTGTTVQNQIGAITLYLDYNPSIIEITNVTMPENGGGAPVFETKNGLLYIGWVSPNPIQIAENQSLILIHARLAEAYRNSNLESEIRKSKIEIRFALNENPMSELADNLGNVISGTKLSVSDGKQQTGKIGMVSVYPVPAKDMLNLEFESSAAGVYDAILTNMQGLTVLSLEKQNLTIGWNNTTIDLGNIPAGAYIFKLLAGDQPVVRKVIVSR